MPSKRSLKSPSVNQIKSNLIPCCSRPDGTTQSRLSLQCTYSATWLQTILKSPSLSSRLCLNLCSLGLSQSYDSCRVIISATGKTSRMTCTHKSRCLETRSTFQQIEWDGLQSLWCSLMSLKLPRWPWNHSRLTQSFFTSASTARHTQTMSSRLPSLWCLAKLMASLSTRKTWSLNTMCRSLSHTQYRHGRGKDCSLLYRGILHRMQAQGRRICTLNLKCNRLTTKFVRSGSNWRLNQTSCSEENWLWVDIISMMTECGRASQKWTCQTEVAGILLNHSVQTHINLTWYSNSRSSSRLYVVSIYCGVKVQCMHNFCPCYFSSSSVWPCVAMSLLYVTFTLKIIFQGLFAVFVSLACVYIYKSQKMFCMYNYISVSLISKYKRANYSR